MHVAHAGRESVGSLSSRTPALTRIHHRGTLSDESGLFAAPFHENEARSLRRRRLFAEDSPDEVGRKVAASRDCESRDIRRKRTNVSRFARNHCF